MRFLRLSLLVLVEFNCTSVLPVRHVDVHEEAVLVLVPLQPRARPPQLPQPPPRHRAEGGGERGGGGFVAPVVLLCHLPGEDLRAGGADGQGGAHPGPVHRRAGRGEPGKVPLQSVNRVRLL